MKIQFPSFWIFFVLMLAACSPGTTTVEPAVTPPPEMTAIRVDGRGEDWAGREVLLEDPIGDTEAGYLDLAAGFGFVNQDALYLYIEIVDPGLAFEQFDFELRGDSGKNFLVTWKPGDPLPPEFEYSSIAMDQGLEARFDLRDLGSPNRARLSQLRVMVGECCEYPTWRAADEWNPSPMPLVNEFDSPEALVKVDVPSVSATQAPIAAATAIELRMPEISIDGLGNDWENVPVIATDPSGDQLPNTADLGAVRAFRNDRYLYLAVNLHEDGFVDHIVFMMAGPDNIGHQLNIWPGGGEIGGETGESLQPITLQSTFWEVVEIKVALDELGITPTQIHYVETCCLTGDQRMDKMEGGAILNTSGTETEQLSAVERTERPVHYRLYYSAMQGDYLFRSFIQIPWGMEVGPDGFLYIADWGGRHIVRVAPDGTQSDLGLWRDPAVFGADGPQDVAFDSQGKLYFSTGRFIYRVLEEGGTEKVKGVVGSPEAIDFGPDGALYYGDLRGNVYRLELGGTAQLIAKVFQPRGITVAEDGTVYVTRWPEGDIVRINPTTGEADDFQLDVCHFDPCYLDIDPEGDIWVRGIFDMKQFSPDGSQKPYSVRNYGAITPGGDYGWHSSAGIAFDAGGNLWVASYNSKVQKLILTNPNEMAPLFEVEVLAPGLEASDLEVGPQGEVYATDGMGRQLLRFDPNGEATPVVVHGSAGREAVAVDQDGVVYFGAFGEIRRLEPDGSSIHYASLVTERMVFGGDGYLYAVEGAQGQDLSIVRITGVDQLTTVATELGGEPLGNQGAFLMRGAGTDLLVFVTANGNLYRMDPDGQAELIGSAPGVVFLAAASPRTQMVYFISHHPKMYTLKSMDPQGNIRILGSNFIGDPWGMAVSPDGQILYIAESGAVDRIYLGE